MRRLLLETFALWFYFHLFFLLVLILLVFPFLLFLPPLSFPQILPFFVLCLLIPSLYPSLLHFCSLPVSFSLFFSFVLILYISFVIFCVFSFVFCCILVFLFFLSLLFLLSYSLPISFPHTSTSLCPSLPPFFPFYFLFACFSFCHFLFLELHYLITLLTPHIVPVFPSLLFLPSSDMNLRIRMFSPSLISKVSFWILQYFTFN